MESVEIELNRKAIGGDGGNVVHVVGGALDGRRQIAISDLIGASTAAGPGEPCIHHRAA